ncbi:class I SAM-dependent methyltransferase [Gallaecimonas mangrovi]|uniref:class I SAM-dependent methyltransferase n=1 Tax=Gallaecimonas mangrovi TaxID=2291597 RepID=UPI000E2073E1|nr:SAM-dependent methyltransferase [Gallaecimonas mangrovi]
MQRHIDTFKALTELLSANRADWQFVPFATAHWPWPELAFLQDLEPQTLEAMDSDAISALVAQYRPGLPAWLTPTLPAYDHQQCNIDSRLGVGIAGRKWQQIKDFSAAVPVEHPVLEWCAGKGHLGRVFASKGHPVTSLEWQAELCQQGQALATKGGFSQHFECADAFADKSQHLITANHHAMALHACGDLHCTLLQQAVKNKAPAISISPCCYHLIRSPQYQPLSKAGQGFDLALSTFDLRLPLQQQVTGGQRAERLRHTEQWFRLAFDCLQRELTGTDAYLSVPNIPKSLLTNDFSVFAQWAAAQKQLTLPAKVAWQRYLDAGRQRQAVVARLDWVRHWYRWPLEFWLLLDRVCFLEEAGYQVRLGAFTDRNTTPRNALIDARKGI